MPNRTKPKYTMAQNIFSNELKLKVLNNTFYICSAYLDHNWIIISEAYDKVLDIVFQTEYKPVFHHEPTQQEQFLQRIILIVYPHHQGLISTERAFDELMRLISGNDGHSKFF